MGRTYCLNGRANDANSWEADRFISIHHNSFSNRSVNGTETYNRG
ncbi:MAG: hypothetical protein GXY86_09925 [Firmicutes bacterium]|nr:hypothetical protein [Bacillota bacterium]